MKYKYFVLLVFCMLCAGYMQAQTATDWQPLTLNINGTNDFSGVDAQYTVVTCNNNDYILIELSNHNSYAVKACWKNVVINTNNEKLSSTNTQDSVMIQPNSSLRGDCMDNTPRLMMKLTDFGILKEDFKAFMISGFDFVIIHR